MDWTRDRHIRILTLRQEALERARDIWANYILVRSKLLCRSP